MKRFLMLATILLLLISMVGCSSSEKLGNILSSNPFNHEHAFIVKKT